jgi:hypothetical protein
MGTWTAMKHELAQLRTQDTGGDRELLLIGRARRRRRPSHL